MNEFVAKKLGEVLAFATVGKETFEKGKTALESVFGADKVEEILSTNEKHIEEITALAQEHNVTDIVMKKLDGTGTKLRAMRELYVGDQWDNATELLEWSGFFEGAAVVHWALVSGAGEALSQSKLQTLASGGKDFHQGLLYSAGKLLHSVGHKKAL